jgi:hypothetical protein
MRTSFIIVAALLAVALPTAALASRAPSRSEKKQLRSAVKASKKPPKSVRKGHFKLRNARVSTKGPWAKSSVLAGGVYNDPFNPVVGLFKRRHAHWKLVALGTSRVGCSHPRAPRAVRKDLKLRCR